MTTISNGYKIGSVIWDNFYQKYLIIVGYDINEDKYLVDNHEFMKLSKTELDNFKCKKYYKEDKNMINTGGENE